jgi:hypothetical protein
MMSRYYRFTFVYIYYNIIRTGGARQRGKPAGTLPGEFG